MHRVLAVVLFAPSVVLAQSAAAWKVDLNVVKELPTGECREVGINLIDSTGKEAPRRSDGQRVAMADFDMSVSPTGPAVGKYQGANSWSVCACPGASPGTAVTVTASYPSAQLPERLRVRGVAFAATRPVTVVKGNNSGNPQGCESATTTVARASTMSAATNTMAAPVSSRSTSSAPMRAADVAAGAGVYVAIKVNGALLPADYQRGTLVSKLAYELTRPMSGGIPTGRRVYTPLSFVKEWSIASPLLMIALAQNQQVEVQVDHYSVGANGIEEVTETIIVKQARIVGIRHFSENGREMEEVSVSFQTISFENKKGNTIFTDSASPP